MRRTSLLATTWLTAALFVVAACAGVAEKDRYNLFNPTPVNKMRGFSTDRPPLSPRSQPMGQPLINDVQAERHKSAE
jgi:hypothetical protein